VTASPLERAILELADEGGPAGRSMGAIVDRLVAVGHEEAAVEQEVWALLRAHRLTIVGFARLTLRRGPGHEPTRRAYDMMLIPWSPARDPG